MFGAFQSAGLEKRLRFDAESQRLLAEALRDTTETGALLARHSYLLNKQGTGRANLPLESALHEALRWTRTGEDLRGHRATVRAIASDNAGSLFSASEDGEVRMWRFGSHDPASELAINTDVPLSAIAVGKLGQIVVIAGDSSILLYHRRTGVLTPFPVTRGRNVASLALSPGDSLLAAGDASGAIQLWRVATRRLVGTLHKHRATVWSLAFIPDPAAGLLLLSGDVDNTAYVSDWTNAGAPEVREQMAGVSVAASENGRWIATGSRDGNVRVRSLRRPNEQFMVPQAHRGYVTSLAFAPKDSVLVSVGTDGSVRLYGLHSSAGDIRGIGVPREFGNVGGEAYTVAFLPEGTVAAAGMPAAIRIWHNVPGMSGDGDAVLYKSDDAFGALALSVDGVMAAAASSLDPLGIHDAKTAQGIAIHNLVTAESRTIPGPRSKVTAVAIRPDNRVVAAATSDSILLFDVERESRIASAGSEQKGEVRLLTFSPDGRLLATAGRSDTATIWSADDRLHRIRAVRHGVALTAMAFGAAGRYFATAGRDSMVRVWSTQSDTQPPIVLGPYESDVTAVAFHPTNDWIATSTENSHVRLRRLDRSGETRDLPGHWSGTVTSLMFAQDGSRLAAGTDAGSIVIWAMGNDWQADDSQHPPGVLAQGTGAVLGIAFSRRGDRLITGEKSGTISQWLVGADKLAELICVRVNRNLTKDEWERFLPGNMHYERSCPNHPAHESLLEEGRELARRGRLDSAVASFESVIAIDPSALPEPPLDFARRHRFEKMSEVALRLAGRGSVDSAMLVFRAALELGAVTKRPDAASAFAKAISSAAQDLARTRTTERIASAIALVDSAWSLDSTVVLADELNSVCWAGALDSFSGRVLTICERAVREGKGRPMILDSRGVARARLGKVDGAIKDFEDYAKSEDTPPADRQMRWEWVQKLRAGTDPQRIFTEELLRRLRSG